MVDDFLVGEFVGRHGVAVAAACGQTQFGRCRAIERVLDMRRREQVHPVLIARTHIVGAAPHFVLPVDNRAVGGHPASRRHRHCRAERLQPKFVVAHPLQLYDTPLAKIESSAASSAASSAPLWP